MTIIKALATGNGLANAHRVFKAELLGEVLQLQVNMYPSLEDAEHDRNLLWQEYPSLPLTVFETSDPWGSIERGLVDQVQGLFSRGTIVAAATIDDLENARLRKWSELKLERDALESGGFDLANVGRFDSDTESRARIVGATMAAKIARDAGQGYAIRWTLADNTSVELDADGVIAAGFALLAHIDGIHQRSRALYAELNAAETTEAVAAVRWNVGWNTVEE